MKGTAFAVAATIVMVIDATAIAAGRNVTFVSTDGTSLAGQFYEAFNPPTPGVVLVHMMGRSKDEWSPTAERLQDAGITVLAMDLRGHGSSGGNGAMLAPMVGDVQAAVQWLPARPGVRPDALAVVGASLGANLAAIAAAGVATVRGVALISPSLDYRGVRIDATVMRKIGNRPVWRAASTDDPYALRTVKELATGSGAREQRLSGARAHGTALLGADPELATGLVDWLRRTLIF
ncbi:MAG: alpha/beta fold hydrolase [Acidobacteria bacterium]|nr:alpha/beta fold hydrolase [Acidobacteriota bacterium]